MWAWRDYFPLHFLSLLFFLLNQTVENAIFHYIFLSLFSILPVFTPTKHTLRQPKIKNKVSLQVSLEINSSNFSYISFLGVNFENLSIKFHVLYIFNMHIKFYLNRMSFIIRSKNLFFIQNFKSQKFENLTFL